MVGRICAEIVDHGAGSTFNNDIDSVIKDVERELGREGIGSP